MSRSDAQSIAIDRYDDEALTRLDQAYKAIQKQINSDSDLAESQQYEKNTAKWNGLRQGDQDQTFAIRVATHEFSKQLK